MGGNSKTFRVALYFWMGCAALHAHAARSTFPGHRGLENIAFFRKAPSAIVLHEMGVGGIENLNTTAALMDFAVASAHPVLRKLDEDAEIFFRGLETEKEAGPRIGDFQRELHADPDRLTAVVKAIEEIREDGRFEPFVRARVEMKLGERVLKIEGLRQTESGHGIVLELLEEELGWERGFKGAAFLEKTRSRLNALRGSAKGSSAFILRRTKEWGWSPAQAHGAEAFFFAQPKPLISFVKEFFLGWIKSSPERREQVNRAFRSVEGVVKFAGASPGFLVTGFGGRKGDVSFMTGNFDGKSLYLDFDSNGRLTTPSARALLDLLSRPP